MFDDSSEHILMYFLEIMKKFAFVFYDMPWESI